MYCKKCGAKNETDANFCTECGTSLSDNMDDFKAVSENISSNQEGIHDSIVRKALKKSAKDKNKGALYGMVGMQIAIIFVVFLMLFLSAAGSAVTGSTFVFVGLLFFFMIAYFIFTIIISIGMMKASLRISRGKTITFGDAFKGIFKNFSQCLKAIGVWLLYCIGMGILMCIPFIGWIATLVLEVYLLPVMVALVFMILDDKYKDISIADMFQKTMDLVKGHRVQFYGLMFSFIGWIILAMFTFGILYIWLIPYMMVAMSNWYLSLNGEISYTDGEKGLSNIAIIGIAVVSYFVFIFIIIVSAVMYIVTADIDTDDLDRGFNHFTENIDKEGYDYDDTKNDKKTLQNGNIINMSGINVYVPLDYKETTMASYEKIYMSPNGQIYIGTNTQNYVGSVDTFIQNLRSSYKTQGFICDSNEVDYINGVSWNNFSCEYNDRTEINLYITHENNKLYYLIFTDASDSEEGEDLLDKIEDNLNLAY